MDAPSVILFDFFGVLCSEVSPFWLADNLPATEAVALKQGLIHEADKGVISQVEMFGELGRLAQKTADQVLAEWTELAVINPGMVELATDLRQHARVALLSNCPAPFLRDLLSLHQFDGLFEQTIISSEVGLAKPDPAIFNLALKRLQIEASAVLFIDDNPRNVAAAKDLGFSAILFESDDKCRCLLQEALSCKFS